MKKDLKIRMISAAVSVLMAAGMLSGCAARVMEEAEAAAEAAPQNRTAAAAAEEKAQNRTTAAAAEENAQGRTTAAAAEENAQGRTTAAAAEEKAQSRTTAAAAEAVPEIMNADQADPAYAPAAENSAADTGSEYEAGEVSAYGGSVYEAAWRAAYGGDWMNSEEYTHLKENGFQSVAENPLSTFSADVDTASYTNVRRMLKDYGSVYDTDAVRIEEMINYFDYDYELPEGNEVFGVTTQYTDCPWNPEAKLLLVGIRTQEISFSDRPDNNLVFLIDVSGSMYSDDKLPLLQKAFAMLAENLTARDRVSIVTYAGYESVVLEGEPGNHTAEIVNALNDLEAGGSTAGEAGIRRAYEIAGEYFIEGGNNRIILATDGDLNVGISTEQGLKALVTEKRESGVFLSVLGVGSGNLKDSKMETLADNGNGNYSYLDSVYEAKKVLVDEMGGTLVTVAKDVKFQVEFNPAQVEGYRLVGYENRLLADEDFNDDTVDAGEIGAGHTVTVLYEILPAAGNSGSSLKYQPEKNVPEKSSASEDPYAEELLTVSIRYKEPDGETSTLRAYPVKASSYERELPEEASWAAAVAEFGMLLKNSPYSGTASGEDVLRLAEAAMRKYRDDYRQEFYQLVDAYFR